MADAPRQSHAEALDVLFAVALGEGFFAGMYEFKDRIISGEVLSSAEAGQGLYRVLLGFLIIILSWLHYRRSTMSARRYPAGEFVVDILVVITYMTLFLFVEAPITYYWVIAVIWFFYGIARAGDWLSRFSYFALCFAFFGFFAAVAACSSVFEGPVSEWIRLLLVTTAIVAYRPIDRSMCSQH